MKRVKISEKVSFSPIAQGFWRLGKWGWSTSELVDFMHGCLERGVTTFDTAQVYSATLCETSMGNAFAADPSLRNKIQLVSKTGIFQQEIKGNRFGYYDTSYDRIVNGCKESLQRLQTDHLDLFLIHREDPCLDFWEAARAFEDLKKEGLILEAGVSNFDPVKFDCLNTAMKGKLVTNQIEWNPVCFEHFESGMIDHLTVKKIHPMVWSPLAGGRIFTSKEETFVKVREKLEEIGERHGVEPAVIAYAWLMYHPAGAVPISGSNQLERLELALKALDVKLERYEWYEIYTASGQKKLR